METVGRQGVLSSRTAGHGAIGELSTRFPGFSYSFSYSVKRHSYSDYMLSPDEKPEIEYEYEGEYEYGRNTIKHTPIH